MVFNGDSTGLLTSISNCIQGQDYIIDEQLLDHALHLSPSMLELPIINEYLHPLGTSVSDCLCFKQNLSIATDQLIPAIMFDFPVKIGLEFLTVECQFLGKILRQNFMPIREDRNMHPFDLEIIKCVLHECMPYNFAYFLLTSFKYCFHNNFLGYDLLLTHIFKYLEINVINHQFQLIQNSNVVSYLNLPSRPLIVFKASDHKLIESSLNMASQMDALNSMNQIMLHNQSNIMLQIKDMQQSLHHLKDMLHFLMENQKLSMTSCHFLLVLA